MKLNFSVSRWIDTATPARSTRVLSVMAEGGDDLTKAFMSFCDERQLPLTSEQEIEDATRAFGYANY